MNDPFRLLSAPARALFALWALLLCLSLICAAAFAVFRKRYRLAAPALLLLAAAYLLWQVIFDLSLHVRTGGAEEASLAPGSLPGALWLAVLLLLTLAAAALLWCNVRFDRTRITPGSVKLFLDKLPCGICCWRDSGQVLFSNVCMNRLCLALTGEALRNGEHFRAAVRGGHLPAEGRVWRFSTRELLFGGETLHEMIASDVTAEYDKMQALEQEKKNLSRLNRKLRDYTFGIDDTVRRREILQAKVNIHDEMNRLMLATTAADGGDPAALDRIFSLWERNALLLCMEADEAADAAAAERLEKLAAALGVRLILPDALPDALTERQRSLFFSCAQEALANAVKHAGAKTVTVSCSETETQILCRFANDGTVPSGPVRFTGGLANLSLLADRQDAAVSAEAGSPFTLVLRFPREQNNPEEISPLADAQTVCGR